MVRMVLAVGMALAADTALVVVRSFAGAAVVGRVVVARLGVVGS